MITARSDLAGLIDRHCRGRRQATALPGLTLFRAGEPSPQVNTLYRPTLCVVAQGRKRVAIGERLYTYDSSDYLVVTVDLAVAGCIIEASPDRPYLALSLDLNPVSLGASLRDLPPHAPRAVEPAAIAVSRLDANLRDALVRLVALLDRPQDAVALAPLVEREILYRLLTGAQGALLRQAATAGSHLAQVGRAADWLRDNHAARVTVEHLAGNANMSVTSFHRHFKAITSLSPLQYRTHVRLQEARRLMLTGRQDVAAIGFAVGYDSPSQFSRDYRRMFGAPPATDAARLRQGSAA